MNITSMFHVNVNCGNFDVSKAFDERLGFRVLTMVPERNTPEVAAAVGMPPYHVRGALMALPGETTLIDLLEWKEPRDREAPYPHLYHLGLARIALATSDLETDMKSLEDEGVEFLSEPATVELEGGMKSRFVRFKDPDGTILELVESA